MQTQSDSELDPSGPLELQNTVPESGVSLGEYVLERRLGAGGMGEVYAARRGPDGELVALKTLSRASAVHLIRFKREFRVLADVEHPNLVRLFELGVGEDGRNFFTMELVDGVPFVDWVRAGVADGELPDLARLDAALRQLVVGVARLHRGGVVHRDLKPSNVLVDAGGRAVILDFGLLAEIDAADHRVTRDGQMLGTPTYMSPEQARGERAGPASDVYSLGVMLVECLTGAPPHEGGGLTVMLDKQRSVELGASLAAAPARLRELCEALLRRDPERRPTSEALIGHFEAATRLRPRAPIGRVFIGREAELERLHAAAREVATGDRPVVVHLRGQSGVGKSTLLRRFAEDLQDDAVLALRGRCRERETVPYKGLDAVVDDLSVYLRRLPARELASLQPRSVDALERVFPVLRELWSGGEPEELGPRVLRGVSWGALREVLGGVAAKRPVALIIDDMQWTDDDSVELLHALLRGQHGAKVLVVLGLRDDIDESEAWRSLSANPMLGAEAATTIEIGPLSDAEARELAAALASERGPDWAETVALRSGGSPMFIEQLVLGGDAASDDDLDDLFERRLDGLDPAGRAALEVITAAGGPIERSVVLELCQEASADDIEVLRELGLIVVGRARDEPRVETAHDRLRDVALGRLEPEARAGLHRRLGEALLARSGGAPGGEHLYRIAQHFAQGVADASALADEDRRQIAEITCMAGELALHAASHAAARRYFAFAHELTAPWRSQSSDDLDLCVRILTSYARSVYNQPEVTAINEELFAMPLSAMDYAHAVNERILELGAFGEPDHGIDLGMRALARLDAPIPRRPTLVWIAWQILLGRRALLRRLGGGGLASLPKAEPGPRTATTLLLCTISAHSMNTDRAVLGMGLLGLATRMLMRHGPADDYSMSYMLGCTYMIASGLQRSREVGQIRVALEAVPLSPNAAALQDIVRVIYGPRRRPYVDVVGEIEPIHRRIGERGVHLIGALVRGTCVGLMFETDTPLPEIIALADRLQQEFGRLDDVQFEVAADAQKALARAFIAGPRVAAPPDARAFTHEVYRCIFEVRAALCELVYADFARARECLGRLPHNFERVMFGGLIIPISATIHAVAFAESWVQASGRERRRARRRLRKWRATVAKWAAGCPANYAPMLALIDAEREAIAGRESAAMKHYEAARSGAATNRMRWLEGLASARLAALAQRCGHPLMATAALQAARDAYAAWGATARARELDEALAPSPDRGV